MKRNFKILLTLPLVMFFIYCSKNPYPGFDKNETGLYYKIIRGSSEKTLPIEGDVLTVDIKYFIQENDSLLFSSYEFEPIQLPVMKSLYQGDINEGLLMITEGDSGVFIVKADSFLIHNANLNEMPPFINSESMLRFEVKVLSHKSSEEYMAEMKIRQEEYESIMGELEIQESIDRENWLKDNSIKVKPTESGMYYIENVVGQGPKVEHGDLVTAIYTGYFLNGQIFDSNAETGQNFSFVAGRGEVIKGWDEAVMKMKKGGKARIIIPSELAYGTSAPNHPIPPYSTLVFDIEVVDVEKGSANKPNF